MVIRNDHEMASFEKEREHYFAFYHCLERKMCHMIHVKVVPQTPGQVYFLLLFPLCSAIGNVFILRRFTVKGCTFFKEN